MPIKLNQYISVPENLVVWYIRAKSPPMLDTKAKRVISSEIMRKTLKINFTWGGGFRFTLFLSPMIIPWALAAYKKKTK